MPKKNTCNEINTFDLAHYTNACDRLNKFPPSIVSIHQKYTMVLEALLNVFFENLHPALFHIAYTTKQNTLASQLFDDNRILNAQKKNIIQKFLKSVSITFSQLDSSHCALAKLCKDDNFSPRQLEAFNQSEANNALIIASLTTRINSVLLTKNEATILKPKGLGVLFGQYINHLSLCSHTKEQIGIIFDDVIIHSLEYVYIKLDEQLNEFNIPSANNIDEQSSDSYVNRLTEKNKQHSKDTQHKTNIVQLIDNIFHTSKKRNILSEEQQFRIFNTAQKELLSISSENILDDIIIYLANTQAKLKIIGEIPSHTIELIRLTSITFKIINQNKFLDTKIKHYINRLLIPTIKTTLIDKQFFNQSDHPLRILLNEIHIFGLGWQDNEDPSGESSIVKTIDRITTNICLHFTSNTPVLSLAMIELKKVKGREEKQLSLLNSRLAVGAPEKELADDAASIATKTIEAELDRLKPSAVICVFSRNLWQKVLTVTALQSGVYSPQWKHHEELLQELCYLATPCQSDVDRNKRVKRLSNFMLDIQQSLALCAYSLFDAEEIIESLSLTLIECLKGNLAERVFTLKNSHEIEIPNPKNIEYGNQKNIDALNEGELHDQLNQSSSQKTQTSKLSKEEHTAVNTSNSLGNDQQIHDPALELKISGFARGMLFDWHDPNKGIIRCRLAAIIKQTNNYIFINRNGIKVVQLSLNETINALKEKKLTTIENNNAAFDTALEEVVSGMRRDKDDKLSGNY